MTGCITVTAAPETGAGPPAPRITSFLLKVASRCNLDCDYCYVYHHGDATWREMPRVMPDEVVAAFGEQLREYAASVGLSRCSVIMHGGEPLLAGASWLAAAGDRLRSAVRGMQLDLGLQTNGLLLDGAALSTLETAGIDVSLSLDGPRWANDLHRTSRRGRSSYDRAVAALELLAGRRERFAGVISVIDARVPAAELLEFFRTYQPPRLDFLLPDANHDRPPPGRDADPDTYLRWLLDGFDAWLDRHPDIPVRLFEAVLDAVSGLPSGTDAFGLGDVSLLTVETDGSWHDLDVLKVTGHGATRLHGSIFDTSIAGVAASPRLAAHRRLLSPDGLAAGCRPCPEALTCGGGSVPHRHGRGRFDNPTVYCREMLALLSHARGRLRALLPAPVAAAHEARPVEFGLADWERAETASNAMSSLVSDARAAAVAALREALALAGRRWPKAIGAVAGLDADRFARVALEPGTAAWCAALRAQASGTPATAIDGSVLRPGPDYLIALAARAAAPAGLAIGEPDEWVRAPFGGSILFEDASAVPGSAGLVDEALGIVEGWRPALARELRHACRSVQFVRDPSAHPDKIVSFSDNSVPGALFVSVRRRDGLIDAHDLADSLVHEHRHQKLYLLERLGPTVEPGAPRVRSPWREEPRPVSGLLHAVFVFVELRRLWQHVLETGPARLRARALSTLQETDARLEEGVATLRGCALTQRGRALLDVLDAARRDAAVVGEVAT
jgi:uncharacterized protein